jgi:PAS domain-containing protein
MNDLFATLPQPLFILDTHGKVLHLNPAARALAWKDGLPADDLATLLGGGCC